MFVGTRSTLALANLLQFLQRFLDRRDLSEALGSASSRLVHGGRRAAKPSQAKRLVCALGGHFTREVRKGVPSPKISRDFMMA
jgi:hypothetical protein